MSCSSVNYSHRVVHHNPGIYLITGNLFLWPLSSNSPSFYPSKCGVFHALFVVWSLLFTKTLASIWFCVSVAFCRNEAVIISGRKLAQQIKQEVRQEVEEWVAAGNKRPYLSVVLVGENPASHSYVLNKTKAAADVGRCHARIRTAVKLGLMGGAGEANPIVVYYSFFFWLETQAEEANTIDQ